jgi:GNAT superfamily N-acetyltransferase
MEIHIRRATREDVPELTRLLIELNYFSSLENKPEPSIHEQVARHLRLCNADSSHSVYVAENPDFGIMGYASVHWLPYLFLPGPEGYVSELFVRARVRGQGAGTQLMKEVVTEARERGCSRLSLINMRGRESYQRGYYTQLGWQERPDAANFVYDLEE